MRTWTLRRRNEDSLVFEGEHLITLDDREWLGVTPNWWELSLYRTTNNGFVLGSVYYQNYPRGQTVYGALELPTLESVHHCLRQRCNAPDLIIDALLARARRSIRLRDTPPPPLRLRDAPREMFAQHAPSLERSHPLHA